MRQAKNQLNHWGIQYGQLQGALHMPGLTELN